jgi:hypothetical protein
MNRNLNLLLFSVIYPLFLLLSGLDMFAQCKLTTDFYGGGSHSYVVNSIANAEFQGGRTRIAIPITLPSGTTSWYYRIIVDQSNSQVSYDSFSTMLDIASLVPGMRGASLLKGIIPPNSGLPCDLFIIPGGDNIYNFQQRGNDNFLAYNQLTKLNVTSTTGYVDIIPNQPIAIGIKNNNYRTGIRVQVDVVASVCSNSNIINQYRQSNPQVQTESDNNSNLKVESGFVK